MRVLVESVSFSYGSQPVLRKVSFDCEPGGLNAILGPSGSGKSTLLALVAGLRRPDSGRVLFVSDNNETCPPDPRLCAWVPQGVNALPSRTVVDNVMIGALASGGSLDDARSRAMSILHQVGIELHANQNARSLSGGQLQRLALARAIAGARPILLLDEPTASLDGVTTRSMVDIVTEVARRMVVIVATHDPLVGEAATKVVRLRS